MVLDSLRRLLATAALAAFDPEVGFDLPRDRADATLVTVRRAVAYMEANPDLTEPHPLSAIRVDGLAAGGFLCPPRLGLPPDEMNS